MAPIEAKPAPADDFIVEAERLLTEIRDLFDAVIQEACGPISGAADVAERLGVHRKLGWQVWKVAYGDEPFLSARYMPSQKGLDTWLDAAARCEVPDDLLRRVRAAAGEFDRLVDRHAGDREMLEMMFDSCGSRIDEQADLRWRKQAFIGNSYILGVHAKAQVSTALLLPSAEEDGYIDLIRLHGLIALVRTRPEVRWPIAQTIVQRGDEGSDAPQRQPLDDEEPASDAAGVPLLRRFSSDPAPAVTRQQGQNGLVEDLLEPGPVGQRGATTIVTGEIIRRIGSKYREKEGEIALFGTGVRTPVEVLIVDQFVHRAIFGEVERRLKVFSELISPITRAEHDRLAVGETVQHLGRGLARMHAAEVTHYGEMLRYAFERSGHDPLDFDLFRVRMQYAPIAASVMVENDLLPPPGESTT